MPLSFESSSAFPRVLVNVDYSYYTFKTSGFKTFSLNCTIYCLYFDS
jgi:hypothetical protein